MLKLKEALLTSLTGQFETRDKQATEVFKEELNKLGNYNVTIFTSHSYPKTYLVTWSYIIPE